MVGKFELSITTLQSTYTRLIADCAKIGKRSKWFASDPGLLANLLGWDEESVCV